jgi:type I restriction enzyme M protein
MNATTLISKIWNFCHTLRDDGVGYGDYLEQLTFLLFLKMAHEQKTLNPFESVDVGIQLATIGKV